MAVCLLSKAVYRNEMKYEPALHRLYNNGVSIPTRSVTVLTLAPGLPLILTPLQVKVQEATAPRSGPQANESMTYVTVNV